MALFEPPTQTGVDHVHAHPRHVGHRWIDLILALTALFISGVSLFVAVDHGRTERQLVQENAQLVQANSWPFLQLDGRYSDHGPSSVALVNAGIGPAKLELFQVFYQDRPVADLYRLLELCCGLPSDREGRHAMLPEGLNISTADNEVFRPGQEETLISLPAATDTQHLGGRFNQMSRLIRYRACYCSVFDACWMTDLAGLKQTPVAACPTGEPSFNDQAH